jgi:hypothetical protein
MTASREPILRPVAIAALRPTQLTVGMREVEVKRRAWKARDQHKDLEFLEKHMFPVIRGPQERIYVVDHHHLALALIRQKVTRVLVHVLADFSRLDADLFWPVMDSRGWVHPFDAQGTRRSYNAIPATMQGLLDDPFRSLAGELRRLGGFAKETAPFAEFQWADYLRRRIKQPRGDDAFQRALKKAFKLAKAKDADYLPGWCGAAPED